MKRSYSTGVVAEEGYRLSRDIELLTRKVEAQGHVIEKLSSRLTNVANRVDDLTKLVGDLRSLKEEQCNTKPPCAEEVPIMFSRVLPVPVPPKASYGKSPIQKVLGLFSK